MADVFEAGIDVHYLVNVAGRGWCKLMRARRELRYVVGRLPVVSPLFRFLMDQGGLSPEEAYGNLNMGAGFALFVSPDDAPNVVEVAGRHGIGAWVAGRVEAGPRELVLEPLGITFTGESLAVRS